MSKCGFRTYKERGEWVELRFMAEVMRHGYRVSKPWGDSSAYDVGVEAGGGVLRVQVKSTDCRTKYGYLCQFKPNQKSRSEKKGPFCITSLNRPKRGSDPCIVIDYEDSRHDLTLA